jgi:2',3'-cyclic-nucleotide 2'-phosphodiesterase/3'-nucleotidase
MRPAWLLLLAAAAASAETVTVTILATTDLHGNLLPIDYVTGKPAPRGLAQTATLVRAAEAENPNHLLIDCGDTIQGSPLEYAYQTFVRTGAGPLGIQPPTPLGADPMMLAMNRLGYDAMAVGNHEFNFGLKNIERARAAARFPWISANISGGGRPFAPYVLKTIGGVKIAIIGLTTPAVPNWEKPENLGSYRFTDAVDAVKRSVAELRAREHPDLVIVAAHSGVGRNLDTGEPEEPSENVVYDVAAAVPSLDLILFGHSHRELDSREVGKVLVIQPKNWGMSLARVDFKLTRASDGGFAVASRAGRLIPVRPETPAAADVLELARPYEAFAEKYLDTPVAASGVDMAAATGRVEDTPLIDAVQQVQLFYAHADVSFTALFNPSVHIATGSVTVRQIAALYPYDNELYAIEGSGKMVKDALENAARYFRSCGGARCGEGRLIDPAFLGFNYDMAAGVEYRIDLERPAGSRIHDLSFHGRPLAPDARLRIAINNYRAGGSAGYSMFRGAKIVWRSGEEIRDLIVRYFTERKELPERAIGNWSILPDEARRSLRQEALAAVLRQQLQ